MSSIAAKLKALKNANYQETELLTFPDGAQVIMSNLTCGEDKDMALYLEEFRDRAFGHHVKIETICHAIKWCRPAEGEDIDLRGVKHIETDEVLGDGTPIKVPKARFMRDIVESWPDTLVDTLMARYAVLVDDMDTNIGKGIKVELGDDALQMKIINLGLELRGMVADAKSRGIEIPSSVMDLNFEEPDAEAGDRLVAALDAMNAQAPEPEEIHPLDEQLAKERAENPDVYPVAPATGKAAPEPVVEEPTRVRQ